MVKLAPFVTLTVFLFFPVVLLISRYSFCGNSPEYLLQQYGYNVFRVTWRISIVGWMSVMRYDHTSKLD